MIHAVALRQKLKPVKAWSRDVYWAVIGAWIRNPPPACRPQSLLFICKGNICRSPFAEHLAARLGREYGARSSASAGLEVSQPLPPPTEAVAAGVRFGIDLAGHRSQQVTLALVASSDMVIAMEAGQYVRLRKAFPQFRHKTYLLPLFEPFVGETESGYLRYNIADPYGHPVEDFLACYRRIERCLRGVFSHASQGGRGAVQS